MTSRDSSCPRLRARDLRRLYQTNVNVIERAWRIETAELIAASAEVSLTAVSWFFERFQWDEQPIELFNTEQQKFLNTDPTTTLYAEHLAAGFM
jgi:hypothetical protein